MIVYDYMMYILVYISIVLRSSIVQYNIVQ